MVKQSKNKVKLNKKYIVLPKKIMLSLWLETSKKSISGTNLYH